MARPEPIAGPAIPILRVDRDDQMKKIIVLVMFLALGAVAQGKLAPVEPQQIALSADDLAIATGAAGATLEQDYFRAPQSATQRDIFFPAACSCASSTRRDLRNRATDIEHYQPAKVSLTVETNCLSVNGLARNTYCYCSGRFFWNASSA